MQCCRNRLTRTIQPTIDTPEWFDQVDEAEIQEICDGVHAERDCSIEEIHLRIREAFAAGRLAESRRIKKNHEKLIEAKQEARTEVHRQLEREAGLR